MGRSVLLACVPWLAILAASFAVLFVIARANRARPRPRRLRRLHTDQHGSVQSLSFVLTLPLFIMVLLLIVQVSQLMIGQMVVEYAAFAAARAAAVWIPADTPYPEGANCIVAFFPDLNAEVQVIPVLDPDDPDYGPAEGGMIYRIEPGGAKFEKIASAAVLACMPISPSRDVGATLSGTGPLAADIITRAYTAMAPNSDSGPAAARRIQNKLAYAMANTSVEIKFYHKNSEPPLFQQIGRPYSISPDPDEFRPNELGWQDQITVTVRHDLALLPGPGRLLARSTGAADQVSGSVENRGNVYTYLLSASVTIGNEGEKPAIPYVYQTY